MGITRNCVRFLAFTLEQGVSFENTMMLGRQQLYASDEELFEISEKFRGINSVRTNTRFAEPLFNLLGAHKVDSIDYSNFEEATIIHDLNEPIPDSIKGNYSFVFDGGTLEHIFNFPIAIKNCMDLLQVGGHFVSVTPTNNQCGHGFYQFSPELFYSVLSTRNGFKVKHILLGVDEAEGGIKSWYEVVNPADIKQRVTMTNNLPSYLMVLAEKTDELKQPLRAYQSDYEMIWNVHDSIQKNQPMADESIYMHAYRRFVPGFIKNLLRRVVRPGHKGLKNVDHLGTVNPKFFKKFEVK